MLLKSASDVWLSEGGLEPLRGNHFTIEITDNQGNKMPDQGQFSILTIPAIADGVQIAQYAPVNSYFPVPGMKEHAGCVPFSFRACTDVRALRFFVDWRNTIYSPNTDEIALYNASVGSGKIRIFQPATCPNEPKEIDMVVELHGIWPVVVNYNEFSMDADGTNLTFQVSMAVTDVVLV